MWDRGGGKSGFRNNGDLLVEGIASTILTRPDEPWLVVHHKQEGIGRDIEDEVRALLPPAARVHFLNWGAHDATNEYADVPNIILAGTLFLRNSYYEALGRLASGHPSSSGRFDEEKVKEVTAGEHRHLILQALCRGAVRRCVGEGCPSTRAYIIASRKSGIAEELPDIFPGARILAVAAREEGADEARWQRLFSSSPRNSLRTPHRSSRSEQVMAHLGWKDGKEFKRRIRQHDDFRAALEDAGIEEWGKGRWPKGFRLFGTRFLTS